MNRSRISSEAGNSLGNSMFNPIASPEGGPGFTTPPPDRSNNNLSESQLWWVIDPTPESDRESQILSQLLRTEALLRKKEDLILVSRKREEQMVAKLRAALDAEKVKVKDLEHVLQVKEEEISEFHIYWEMLSNNPRIRDCIAEIQYQMEENKQRKGNLIKSPSSLKIAHENTVLKARIDVLTKQMEDISRSHGAEIHIATNATRPVQQQQQQQDIQQVASLDVTSLMAAAAAVPVPAPPPPTTLLSPENTMVNRTLSLAVKESSSPNAFAAKRLRYQRLKKYQNTLMEDVFKLRAALEGMKKVIKTQLVEIVRSQGVQWIEQIAQYEKQQSVLQSHLTYAVTDVINKYSGFAPGGGLTVPTVSANSTLKDVVVTLRALCTGKVVKDASSSDIPMSPRLPTNLTTPISDSFIPYSPAPPKAPAPAPAPAETTTFLPSLVPKPPPPALVQQQQQSSLPPTISNMYSTLREAEATLTTLPPDSENAKMLKEKIKTTRRSVNKVMFKYKVYDIIQRNRFMKFVDKMGSDDNNNNNKRRSSIKEKAKYYERIWRRQAMRAFFKRQEDLLRRRQELAAMKDIVVAKRSGGGPAPTRISMKLGDGVLPKLSMNVVMNPKQIMAQKAMMMQKISVTNGGGGGGGVISFQDHVNAIKKGGVAK